MRTVLVVLGLAGFSLASCSSGDSGGSGGSGGAGTVRSPTCLAWQDAACDFFADQCGDLSRAECDDVFQSFYCMDDAQMQGCIDALNVATCGGTPAACEGVADPQPAIAWCNEFVDSYCTRAAECGFGTMADCLAQAQSGLDCSLAIGIGPNADQCRSDLQAAACPDIEASVPPSCTGVVKLNN